MIAYGFLAVVAFLLASGPLRARMFRKLERSAPGVLYFSVTNRTGLTRALDVATDFGERAKAMTGAPYVVADTKGVSFWDNTPVSHVGTIGWDRVTGLEVNNTRPNNWRWPASTILLSLRTGEDVVVVPLLRPNGSNRLLPPRSESQWLLSQLRLLREAA
jgi:hypothetical protein